MPRRATPSSATVMRTTVSAPRGARHDAIVARDWRPAVRPRRRPTQARRPDLAALDQLWHSIRRCRHEPTRLARLRQQLHALPAEHWRDLTASEQARLLLLVAVLDTYSESLAITASSPARRSSEQPGHEQSEQPQPDETPTTAPGPDDPPDVTPSTEPPADPRTTTHTLLAAPGAPSPRRTDAAA